jgi:hypothetical protein
MDNYQKYLKYKTKYLNLQQTYKTKLYGGACSKKKFLLVNNNVCELSVQTDCTNVDIGDLNEKKKDIYDSKNKKFKCKPIISTLLKKGYTKLQILKFDYKEIENNKHTFIYDIKDYVDAGFTINDIIGSITDNFYGSIEEFTRIKECFEIMSYSNLNDISFKYLFNLLILCSLKYNEVQFTEIKNILKSKKEKIIQENITNTEKTHDDVCKRIMKQIFEITSLNNKTLPYELFTVLIEFIGTIFEIKPDYLYCKEYIEKYYERRENYYKYLIEKIIKIEDFIEYCKKHNINTIIFILSNKSKLKTKFGLTFDKKEDLEKIGLTASNPNYFYLLIYYLPDTAKQLGLTFDEIVKLNIKNQDKTFYNNFKKIILFEVNRTINKIDATKILDYIKKNFPTQRLYFEDKAWDYEKVKVNGITVTKKVFFVKSFRETFITEIEKIVNIKK